MYALTVDENAQNDQSLPLPFPPAAIEGQGDAYGHSLQGRLAQRICAVKGIDQLIEKGRLTSRIFQAKPS